MNKLTDFSMKNVAAVFIILLLILGGGTYAATSLKMESFPDISFPVVLIQTQYTAPPKDVLDQITKPIEKAVASVEGLKNMTSTSSDNFSSVVIEFEQSRDTEDAKRDIEGLLQNVKLPSNAQNPKVLTFGMASQPVYYLAVYGENGMNQAELDKIYKDTILPAFNSLNGIDHVESIGNQDAVLSIRLDANALLTYNMTPQQVAGSIKAALSSSPAGSVELDGNSQMVRVTGEFNTIYSLDNMVISRPDGGTLLLKQIAKVEAINESTYIARLDGKAAIGINLYKAKSANTVNFADETDRLIEGWKQTHPNVKFHTIYNSAVDIKHSIDGMVREGALGALLASIMILLFLRNFRMTIIVLVSIPLSILITLLVMAPLGITLNIMTLGGIAIAIGRVVDDSIVVIENIYSQLVKRHERDEGVIRYATAQVASAITSSTITTVGVFGPIAFVSGVLGEIFRPFAITLVVALMSSLLVAVTVIPMLAKLMVLNQKNLKHEDESKGKVVTFYKNVLNWSLKNRLKTLLITIIIFVLSIGGTVPFLAVAFMPESSSDKSIMFDIEMPRGTTLEMMDAKMKEIETKMMEAKDAQGNSTFTYVEGLVGYEIGNEERITHRATLFAEVNETTDANEAIKTWTEEMLYEMPKESEVEGTLLGFGPPSSGADFRYNLKGDDLVYLEQAAAMIREQLKNYPELSEVKDSLGEKKSQIEITVDQNKARLYGLSSAQVLEAVSSWIREDDLGELRFDNVLYETKIELHPDDKNSVQKIEQFRIKATTGVDIALSDIAKVLQIDAPASIQREMQSQTLSVTAMVDSVDKAGVIAKITADLNNLELPPGISREVKGISDDIESSFQQMFLAMGASVFIVYLIMVIAFGNASAPFAILFSLPLAAIGGLFALLITNESVNITSLIGFLMLIGIVVTNAIVLLDRVQQLREEGQDVRPALIEAGITRLRPIIMTAGATIIALMPLALGMSKGALISKGLAVVVIGGLITSTLLTLVVVPVIYDIIESMKRRITRKRGGNQPIEKTTVSV
ncbi:efflux RND transporter permease subunit [Paenibacillus turpanensis]|uniref:efflux RND transporter permease subunit n=1 Tax=Paenibacillus turpanensis TaxID=2689078 RepID=UPI001407CF85|nr:efflux RND transporter permease subunit [Paenibacillus turpanensis]